MKDLHHPAFKPLWRRVALVAFCALWTLFEVVNGSYGWALAVAAITAYAGYGFFIAWNPDFDAPKADPKDSDDA